MQDQSQSHANRLREALSASRGLFIWIGLFSLFINLLMLTGPIYMLQIYDTVLSSQSQSTLAALTGLVAALFLGLGCLEIVRGSLLQRVAARFEKHVQGPMFESAIALGLRDQGKAADQPLRDAKSVRQFLTSPAVTAAYDAPWSPAFLLLIYFLHPNLGMLALVGAVILVICAILNEVLTRHTFQSANDAAMKAQNTVSSIVRNVEAVEAMGMRDVLQRRWQAIASEADAASISAGDRNGMFTSSIKVFRLFLQSAMLGLGALLVIQQEITAGVMIAASIILGRALAPLEQGVGQWRTIVATRDAWSRLKALLAATPSEPERMPLPPAKGRLDVEQLYATAPGLSVPLISNIAFSLEPGETLGVIGPSGSGKSTLARALIGVWHPMSGSVRLDGAEIQKLDRKIFGPQFGYLPQEMELFAGTINENISRFELEPDPAAILAAAQEAGCHEMILRFPEGYETDIGPMGSHLSAGQRQRIALARALYREPKYLVLDEPNANLDGEGDTALGEAILKASRRGATVIVISHRPSAIKYVNKLLVIKDGTASAFGPREEIMQSALKPAPVQSRQQQPNGPRPETQFAETAS